MDGQGGGVEVTVNQQERQPSNSEDDDILDAETDGQGVVEPAVGEGEQTMCADFDKEEQQPSGCGDVAPRQEQASAEMVTRQDFLKSREQLAESKEAAGQEMNMSVCEMVDSIAEFSPLAVDCMNLKPLEYLTIVENMTQWD